MALQHKIPSVLKNGVYKGIGEFKKLKHFTPKIRGGDTYSFKYSPEHCFTLGATKWFDTSNSITPILAHTRLQKWSERTESFWWSCLSHNFAKSTARSHAARKLRVAFTESLRKEGFAPDGSRLPGEEEIEPLHGTGMLGALEPILKTKMDSLILQTDQAVAFMIRKQYGDRWPKSFRFGKTKTGGKGYSYGTSNWPGPGTKFKETKPRITRGTF